MDVKTVQSPLVILVFQAMSLQTALNVLRSVVMATTTLLEAPFAMMETTETATVALTFAPLRQVTNAPLAPTQ
jgi:hypothetical protein